VVKPVTAVVIVGGGTAGWLTAGTIAARFQARMKAGGFSEKFVYCMIEYFIVLMIKLSQLYIIIVI